MVFAPQLNQSPNSNNAILETTSDEIKSGMESSLLTTKLFDNLSSVSCPHQVVSSQIEEEKHEEDNSQEISDKAQRENLPTFPMKWKLLILSLTLIGGWMLPGCNFY